MHQRRHKDEKLKPRNEFTLTSSSGFRILGGLLGVAFFVQIQLVLFHDYLTGFSNGASRVLYDAEESLRESLEEAEESLKESLEDRKKDFLRGDQHLAAGINGELYVKDDKPKAAVEKKVTKVVTSTVDPNIPPFLPAKARVPNGDALMEDVFAGKPTIGGIVHLLTTFLHEIHDAFKDLADNKNLNNNSPLEDGLYFPDKVIQAYMDLSEKYLLKFDHVYRNKSVFPIREDESIFISVAAYREHLLAQTLREIFSHATSPTKVFVGVVVQNCFGIDYTCRTGVEVVGTGLSGRPQTKVSDRGPDVNGIEEFCAPESEFRHYCDHGQVRVLYVDEPESFGPAAARYYASKLWGGETFYVQVDSHLQFANDWDGRYISDMKLAKSYPKVVLSTYPPGFSKHVGTTSGKKLCFCEFSQHDIEHKIIRINSMGQYSSHQEKPLQIPFIAAGFFFTRAEFLIDVPFDPLLPWVFMGEEIALSMRAWTQGWDIYAPLKDNIAHQYRPGRMGLPKFWETVGRTFHRPGPGFNTKLQNRLIERVKNLVGYPESTSEEIRKKGFSTDILLKDLDYYGLGSRRSAEEYMDLAGIDMAAKKCGRPKLCNRE